VIRTQSYLAAPGVFCPDAGQLRKARPDGPLSTRQHARPPVRPSQWRGDLQAWRRDERAQAIVADILRGLIWTPAEHRKSAILAVGRKAAR